MVRKGLAKPNQAKWECISEIAINKIILFASIFRILPIDLSDPSATREATEKAKALFGGIDILINNAGTACNCLCCLISMYSFPLLKSTRCFYPIKFHWYARAYTQTSHGGWPLCTLDTDPWCTIRYIRIIANHKSILGLEEIFYFLFVESNSVAKLHLQLTIIIGIIVLAGMLSSGFGHIVVTNSVLGKFGSSGKSSLATAKFGVVGMMDSLRYEVSYSLEP